VDDSIPVRGRTDLALLRFVNEEAAVGSRSIGLGGEFFVQLPQRPFLIEVERGHGGAEGFAFAGGVGGVEERLKADDLFPQVAVAFHVLMPLVLSQPPTSLPISSIARSSRP
jgi:hypothetical protein